MGILGRNEGQNKDRQAGRLLLGDAGHFHPIIQFNDHNHPMTQSQSCIIPEARGDELFAAQVPVVTALMG